MNKNVKRILTGVIGFPMVAALLIWGNVYMVDIAFSLVALLSIREFFHAFSKTAKPIKWIRIFISNTYMFYTCSS